MYIQQIPFTTSSDPHSVICTTSKDLSKYHHVQCTKVPALLVQVSHQTNCQDSLQADRSCRLLTEAVSDRPWMLVDDVLGAFVVLFVFSWEARPILTPQCMSILLLFLRLGSRHCIRRPNLQNIVIYWFLACAQDQF